MTKPLDERRLARVQDEALGDWPNPTSPRTPPSFYQAALRLGHTEPTAFAMATELIKRWEAVEWYRATEEDSMA